MPTRHTPVLDFSPLTTDELRVFMRMMLNARNDASDNGLWIELDLIRILARSEFLPKWQREKK
jgi:hypothetical protein